MLNPSTDPDFTGKIDPPDAARPFGNARDALVENDPNATPLLAKKFNDDWGFDAALVSEAGITPNGDPDGVGGSQRLDALKLVHGVYGTVASLAAGTHPVGSYVTVKDRALGVFLVQSGGTPDGYGVLNAGGGNTATYQHYGEVNVLHVGADKTGASFSTGAFLYARSILTTGVVYAPTGVYKLDKKLSFNSSALVLKGDGPDLTYLNFYDNPSDDYKTGIEVNNGSWNDQTMSYTSSGVSIGSSFIDGVSVTSVNKTNATGVVFARATKGCYLRNVKIVGWDVPYRMYGAWYAHLDGVISQNNSNGGRIGYETNNFSLNGGNYANNTNSHVEFESAGTCRAVAFNGVAFDGLPAQFGLYAKNVSGLSFSGAGYMEIYPGDPTTPPMIQIGQNVVNVDISNFDIILPNDDSYVGSAVKLGTGLGVGAVGVNIANVRQYNSGTGASIDCTNAREVEFGTNVRVSSPVILSIGDDTIPTAVDTLTVPKTLGTAEFKGLLSVVRRPFSAPIKVQYMFSEDAVFSGQKLRILRGDSNAVVAEVDLGAETGGVIVDLPPITGLISDTPLIAYTYKVGSSITWPDMTILCQQI